MTDTTATPARWMSRREAANYLRISVRQLDRLGVARSYIGRRPLYSRDVLDAHLTAAQTTPPPRPKRVRTTVKVPLAIVGTRRRSGDGTEWLNDIRAALQAA